MSVPSVPSSNGNRKSFPPGLSWLTLAGLAGIIIAASVIQIVPRFGPSGPAAAVDSGPGTGQPGTMSGGGPGGPNAAPGQQSGPAGTSKSGGPQGGGNPVATAATGLQCNAQHNGGTTDTGVTATSIKLESTIVNSGVGEAFLGPVQYGMAAVVHRVNGAGGICGRHLALTMVDDAWNPVQGCNDIQSFINDSKVFALPVVPSSEGLNQCIKQGVIHQAKVPVIGTDGMLYSQYEAAGNADWVWPVAASTLSTMHIMAYDAIKNHGAHSLCLVYDSHYHFGQEGKNAFDGEVQRLGGQIAYEEPLDPTQNDYSSGMKAWNDNCSNVDFVGMLLEPDVAAIWLGDGPQLSGPKGKAGVAGAQPMFSTALTNNCGDICDGIKVYTGYRPIFDPAYNTMPAVERYASDVKGQSTQADLTNQFLEGGYDGMLLTVAAFQAVGPDLTRDAVRAWLDSATFDSDGQGLTTPLKWTAGHHFANLQMKAYAMLATSGRVTGYRPDPAGFITDPAPGQDPPQGS